MNRTALALLAVILSVSTMTFAQTPFPANYRENTALVKKTNCAGVIISRYVGSEYALAEYVLPGGDMLFLVVRSSVRDTYFKKAGSSDTALIPFAEAKARYNAALNLPVPDAIPICTPIPTGDNTK